MLIKKWKVIREFNFIDTLALLKFMDKNNYYYSPWIRNIVNKYNYNFKSYFKPIELYRISLNDLEFKRPTVLKDVYSKSIDHGFKLINPELALLTRLFYNEQPQGEWLRFATPFNSMIDEDGIPHLPKIGKALNSFFIETYWAYENAIFHPHNEFVFLK